MKVRTSSNDLLRVDFLAAAAVGLPGRIGLTIAPGTKDRGRGWDRDLTADLARLRAAYDATLLVSLMEEAEYAALEIPDLIARAEAAGMATRWFPIRDLEAPPPWAMAAFRELVEAILASARRGATVAIHCRGGLGRSGLVGASCLVALGHEPGTAIRLVRQARPGAVESLAQEQWIAAFAAEAQVGKVVPSAAIMRGCLLGGALGDALGSPIEFENAAEITRAHGTAVPGSLAYAGGDEALITDDTQMTLFSAEGLIRAAQPQPAPGRGAPIDVIKHALLRWHQTQSGASGDATSAPGWLVGERRLHARRAPGGTCMSALAALARDPARAHTVASPANHSKGCGAVMRSAPFGLAAPTRAAAFALARDAGALTHGHPSGHLSGAYLAAVVWDLARGERLDQAMALADGLLVAERGHQELVAIMKRVRALATNGPPGIAALEALGGGWVGEEALAIALACALTFDPSEPDGVARALWRSVLHSGDSDSTGSITGNLLGAMLGEARLPARWLAQLELRDVILQVATDLHAAATGAALDADRYPPS